MSIIVTSSMRRRQYGIYDCQSANLKHYLLSLVLRTMYLAGIKVGLEHITDDFDHAALKVRCTSADNKVSAETLSHGRSRMTRLSTH